MELTNDSSDKTSGQTSVANKFERSTKEIFLTIFFLVMFLDENNLRVALMLTPFLRLDKCRIICIGRTKRQGRQTNVATNDLHTNYVVGQTSFFTF